MSNIIEGEKPIEAIIAECGSYASVTKGTSMRPLFKTDRDMIVILPPTHPLKKYDVPLYHVGDKYILHRIIGVDEAKKIYIIRGDNTFVKEYVPFDKVIGVLATFNRKGKHHSVNDKGYRLYSRFWNWIYPFRFIYFKSRRLASRIIKGKKTQNKDLGS